MSRLDQLVADLRRFPPLAGEDEYQVRRIATHVSAQRTEAGQTLLTEGDPARAVHLVVEGRAAVSAGGRALGEVGPGAILGEMGMLDNSVSSATVTVTEPGLVLTVDRLGFESLLDSPAISRAISTSLAERVRRAESRPATEA